MHPKLIQNLHKAKSLINSGEIITRLMKMNKIN